MKIRGFFFGREFSRKELNDHDLISQVDTTKLSWLLLPSLYIELSFLLRVSSGEQI